ncbi:xylanase inhibitor protein 2-like [Panicum miliaceum]|uniref:Xylanase inhibitor protein 2-like n=1 Tax=Panicum miliaceum TaxID=4540 RepID=A0A3L6Q2A2_PANMI|nr:xylanase inhibitor protein 2-like [Panicum miliaceum]
MAAFRWLPCRLLLALLFSVLAVGSLAATGPGDIAVFWGRNKDEGTLREACDTGSYTAVIISFLTGFGGGANNSYSLDLSGHPLAGVGDDIKHCQSKGILVLLSIGGPAAAGGAGANYSLPTPRSAAELAGHLWDAYLGGSRPGVPRPFGDAALDGVDFYIDQPGGAGAANHYDEIARRLSAHNQSYHRGRRPGRVTLTATVRCAFPDPSLAAALATGLFARVHVRLYGGDLRCEWGQFDSWNRWAAAYPGSRVFVGVVASPEADRDAYLFQKDLYYGILQFAQKVPNYGGLMIWDRQVFMAWNSREAAEWDQGDDERGLQTDDTGVSPKTVIPAGTRRGHVGFGKLKSE